MREAGTFEAKNQLSALLDQVERDAEILITRHWRGYRAAGAGGSRIRSQEGEACCVGSARSQQDSRSAA